MAKGDRLPRLLKLIRTIQSRPGLTAEELARECGVVCRQIYRDLKNWTMRECRCITKTVIV